MNTTTTLEKQFGAMTEAELTAYESNLRKRLAGASTSQVESICSEVGCDWREITGDYIPARDGGDLISFIQEQIVTTPRGFRTNYRKDQRIWLSRNRRATVSTKRKRTATRIRSGDVWKNLEFGRAVDRRSWMLISLTGQL